MNPLRRETLHWRVPRRGYGNIIELLDALRAKQVSPRIVAIEVMNASCNSMAQRPPAAAAR
jgi:hypothetical protein